MHTCCFTERAYALCGIDHEQRGTSFPLAGKLRQRLQQANNPQLKYERERLILASSADGAGGARATGVRHWIRYCLWGRDTSPLRWADEDASRRERQDDEELLMDFALWLVYCKPLGNEIAPKTARKYISQVQSWHRGHKAGGFSIGGEGPLFRLRALIKGLRREKGDGKQLRRWGVRTQDLGRALNTQLAGGSAVEQNWRAALTVAFCGLLRGGEFALQDGEVFGIAKNLTRGDVRFFMEGGVLHAGVMIRQLKSGRFAGKDVEVVLRSGGRFFDPVAELQRLMTVDRVPLNERSSTPLFRDAEGNAFTVRGVRDMVKALMRSVGCDPDRFGAHSLRIGGATAALAAGIAPETIRAMGRWSSEVYQIYTRLSREAATRVSCMVASTPFHDLERGFQTDALDEAAEIPMHDVDLSDGDGVDDYDSVGE